MKSKKKRKLKKKWVIWLGLILLGFILYSNIRIDKYAKGRLYNTVSAVPHYHTALVLGTSPIRRNGGPNQYFLARIDAAANLYEAGKVDRILVSGDNRKRSSSWTTQDSGPLIPWSGQKRFSVNPSSSSSARSSTTSVPFSSLEKKGSKLSVSMLRMYAPPSAS